jgi:polar amino acid transport system substrate-binding protein
MKRLGAVLGLCLAVVLGGTTFAAEPPSPTLARIVEKHEVRIGMSGNQPPFTMKARSGKLIGFDVDIANALAAAMGVKLKLVQKPFAELLPALERGEVDLVVSGMTMTPERSLKFNFAGPYYVSGKSVLTNSSELAGYGDAAAFNKEGLTLVSLDGSTSQAFVRNVLSKATSVSAPDYSAAVKMVTEGKAQAMVADLPAIVVFLARNPDKGLTTPGALLTMEPIGIALPAGDPQLETLIDGLLSAMETTGLIDERVKFWFQGVSWLSDLP